MERDHEEWRRPWVDGDDTSAFAPPSDPAAATLTEDPVTEDSEPVAVPPDSSPSGPTAEDEAASDALDASEQTDVPAATPYPQPPPSTWDERDEGPGSPAGSVRPPDTTGTAIAPTRRRSGVTTALIVGLVGALLGTLVTLGVVSQTSLFLRDVAIDDAPGEVTAPTINVEGGDQNIVPTVARAVTPSVVRIDILDENGEELGLGSGVIYTSDGYILTNNHVVEQASNLKVKLSSNESLDAVLVGTDPLNDLAVVKIDRSGLPAINLRLDDDPVVGETAIAIGSPFGLDASVTAGVVSAVGRDITVPDAAGAGRQVIPAVIQTDAAINPGNSGGALVDREGRLIGINTAILSGSGGSQGVGFAIPVSQAKATADQLIETGVVRHAFLGVSGTDVTPEMADRFDMPDLEGAVLTEVTEGSAAEAAGLLADDIIIGLEDIQITSMFDLAVAVRRFQPGEEVTVTYLRDGEEQTVEVTLGERTPGQ